MAICITYRDCIAYLNNISANKKLFILIVIIVYVSYKIIVDWKKFKREEQQLENGKSYELQTDLTDWLESHKLDFKDALTRSGVKDLTSLAQLSVYKETAFSKFQLFEKDAIDEKLSLLRKTTILKYWLQNHDLQEYQNRIFDDGIASLTEFSRVSDRYLKDITGSKTSDFSKLKTELTNLSNQMKTSNFDDSSVDAVNSHMNIKSASISPYVYMFLFTPFIGLLVYLLLTQIGQQVALIYIFNRIKLKFPPLRYCKVTFDWSDTTTVGEMVSFRVQMTKSRTNLIASVSNVTITVELNREQVPINKEYGHDGDPNVIRVSFTPYLAGEYVINVWTGVDLAPCCPMSHVFHAGTIEASRTAFTQFSSTMVCTTSKCQPLVIDPRDKYGNVASYDTDDRRLFKIRVSQAGCESRYIPSVHIVCDPNNSDLTMYIKMEEPGCYQATVTYGGETLSNGEFDIIVLSDEENIKMLKHLETNNKGKSYEARLIADGDYKYDKPKKVFIYISPKQMIVKEFYLKIIGKRLFTFRVCPSTKFTFHGDVNQTGCASFTVNDGCQARVTLATKDLMLVAATFGTFLLRNIGGSETFKDKQAFFYHEVRQLHARYKHAPLTLNINRSDLFNSSYKETKGLSLSGWCNKFTIKFNKEEGLDYGGLQREWFELLCHTLFDPSPTGMFSRFNENSQGLVHPNPKHNNQYRLKHYEFAGRIVGKCLYESSLGATYRQNVKAAFTRSFLAQIIGLRVNYKHFESDDPQLYTSKMKYIKENDTDGLDLYFTHEQYDDTGRLSQTVDLIPNGSKTPVTDINKHAYLDCLTQHILVTSITNEMAAFLTGLNELIPDNLLSIFDENELELLLCGTNDYNIEDFRQHHIQCGSTPTFNKVVGWFWTIVSSFTSEQMARLLQFTTGSSMLPPGGFCDLSPNFQLTPSFNFSTLPTAHTCFNQLCLPDHANIESFHKALCLAINEGSQGFGFT